MLRPRGFLSDGATMLWSWGREQPDRYRREKLPSWASRFCCWRMEEAVGHLGKVKAAFVHAAALEEAKKLQAMVEERLTCVEVLRAELPPALGVRTHPGTAGVCYFPV